MYDFMKNPQPKNAHAFLPLNISVVGSVNAILKRILAPLYQDSAKRALVSSLYPNRKKDAFLTVNQFYAKVKVIYTKYSKH